MNFPFSIIGFFVYLFYIFIVMLVVVLPLRQWILKNKTWQWWVINPIAFVFLAAPIAEEYWIQYQFKTLCADAGVHVVRRVVVDGYYDSTYGDPSNKNKIIDTPKEVKRFKEEGFLYKEVRTLEGKVRHRELKNGKIEQAILDKPEARYYFKRSYEHAKVGHQIEKLERVMFDSVKKEVIGRDTFFARYPGWIEGLWIQFIGNGQNICSGPLDKPEKHKRKGQIYKYVLIPNNTIQGAVK